MASRFLTRKQKQEREEELSILVEAHYRMKHFFNQWSEPISESERRMIFAMYVRQAKKARENRESQA